MTNKYFNENQMGKKLNMKSNVHSSAVHIPTAEKHVYFLVKV